MPVKELSDKNTDGTRLGQSTTDLVGFYGATPISQRANAAQATTAIASSTDFAAAQVAALIEVMNFLTAIGAWKGSA